MRKIFVYSYILLFVDFSQQNLQEDIQKELNNSSSRGISLSRKRRYLIFPAGSSLQLVYCMTIPFITVGEIFTVGSTAALAWELPSTPEEIFILSGKKKITTTTTTEPPTTTLPMLFHDEHDHHSLDYSDYTPKRIDKPLSFFPNNWTYKNKFTPAKNSYSPFFINKGSLLGYTPVRQKNYISQKRNYKPHNLVKLSNPYRLSAYNQVHRRTRRDLYEKIEKLLSALNKDGRACLLKAICEVSQVPPGKGTLLQELTKTIFRIKPHENYPDEDHYDGAINREHNCTEQYPSCDNSVWTDMF